MDNIKTMKNRCRPYPATASARVLGLVPALVLGLGLVLVLSACTYRAGDEDNPIRRSFSWFSYLNADDLRSACTRGAPERYRIVYNAVWQEQVRTYDFIIHGNGGDVKIIFKLPCCFSWLPSSLHTASSTRQLNMVTWRWPM